MEKRLILALIFSILILVMWSMMFPQPKQKPLTGERISKAKKEKVFEPQPVSQLIVPQKVKEHKLGKDIVVDNPLYKAVFSTQGGVLTSFQLKKYPEGHIRMEDIDRAIASSRNEDLKRRLELLKEIFPTVEGVEMVSLFSLLGGVFPFSLFWQEDLDLNYGDYQIDKRDNILIFSFQLNDNLKIIKEYTLRKDTYLIDVEVKLVNKGRKSFSSIPLLVRYGPGLGLSTDTFNKGDPYYRGLVLIKEAGGKKVVREPFRGRIKSESVITRNYPEAMWGGLENKYFTSIFLPPEEPHSIWLEKDSFGHLNAGLKMQMPELIAGGVISRRFSLYLGPKQEQVLKALGSDLEKSVDYGMLASSLKIMDILRFFYGLTRNWGLAIIMLTILAKIILFPLTQKSLRSMESMQSLQPKMKEIRLKYKDNPQKMNRELMALYRQHRVNPMGGCFPMMIQMPIFIALFTTLRNTIDLRGARFLWVKDLSLPDTVCYIGGIPLNPLPLIMGLSMFGQQKMSTADPEQAKMMFFMPIMFTFLFYNFSSGLVLYWFVQNILTLGHQYFMRIYAKKG